MGDLNISVEGGSAIFEDLGKVLSGVIGLGL